MSLLLHAGAVAITREGLANLPQPIALGPRHNPFPFIEDVVMVEQELNTYGLHLKDEAYGVLYEKNGNPTRYFGLLELTHNSYNDFDHAVIVGLRGSYDKSISRGLAVGSRVLVCDNLAFSGEIVFHTRQTTNIADRLPRMIADAVSGVPQLAERQKVKFDLYRHTELPEHYGEIALIELMRREVLNANSINVAISEWDKPSYYEHQENGFTIWRLMNAVTEAIKPRKEKRQNILSTWDRTITMTKYLDELLAVGKCIE